MIELSVNQRVVRLDIEPEMPLLWALREALGLTGTKFGCGIGQCGACTVHVDGEATRSCLVPVSALQNKRVVTIEGLSKDGTHPVQLAWRKLDAPQCGFCQPGQLMAAAALLRATPKPTDADIDGVMTNICRCGTY